MNNQISASCGVSKQSPFDDVRDQLSKEQFLSESIVSTLYDRLYRALDPALPSKANECEPSPERAEICHSIHSALSVQRGINAQLQDILSRLAI